MAIAAQASIITDTDRIDRFSDLGSKVELASKQVQEVSRRSLVLTGSELDKLNEMQVEQMCQYEEIVFARTTPEQKLRIVHEFKRRRCVVAMTGDGVNDAPSLKAADCEFRRIGAECLADRPTGGIAMGEGSDVAREAADMVLLDDFSAIVVALEYGESAHYVPRSKLD